MLIRSVAVRSYRTLCQAKVELTPGLNVIHGDNDVGKSTLMDALRCGLVRRGKLSGKLLEAMRPRDGGQPEVEVCFEHGGVVYQVHKKFGPNGSTRLHQRSGKGVFREVAGDPDEELLRILRFGERLASGKASELGILPLLWVRQGTSGAPPRDVMAGEPYDALHARLAELSGPVLAGADADQVLVRVHAEYERHFQPVLGKAKKGSPLDLAGDELQAAILETTQLRAQRNELEGFFTRHEACARDRLRFETLLPGLKAEVERTGTLLTAARALHAQRATAEAVTTAKRLAVEAARSKVTARCDRRRSIAALGEELSDGERAAGAAQETLAAHDAGREHLVDQVDAATEAEVAADLEHRVARAAVDALMEGATLADLEGRLADAEAKQRLILEHTGRLGGMRLVQADLERLAKLERQADTAEAVLDAAAARIEVHALRDTPIDLGGEPSEMRAGERMERRLTVPTTLRIGDVAEVFVQPGGRDLASMRQDAEKKRTAFSRALTGAGVTSLAQARAAVEARRGVEAELALARGELAAVAPSGVQELQERCAAQRTRVSDARAVLDQFGAGAPGTADVALARAHAAATERRHREARDALDRARAALARHDTLREKLRGDHSAAAAAAAGCRKRLADAEAALATTVESDGSDDGLTAKLREAEIEAESATRAVIDLDSKLANHDLEQARLRAEAAVRARDQASTQRATLDKDMHGLEVRLDQAEGLDLDDRIDAADARLGRAKAEHERRREEAEAVRLLYETLSACREEAQQRFLAPLAQEVQRLASLLDPTGKIELDPDYGVAFERAEHGTHAFDDLGGGCKEQVATVVRLAMAKVLAGDEVLPVLLDDAMVNTSDARFDRMADVLLRMAERLQIVVFTCHWERYAALGAHNAVDLGRVRGQLDGRLALAG